MIKLIIDDKEYELFETPEATFRGEKHDKYFVLIGKSIVIEDKFYGYKLIEKQKMAWDGQ